MSPIKRAAMAYGSQRAFKVIRMATEQNYETWDECEEKIQSIETRYGSQLPGVWFRGQANSTWSLLSTLERRRSELSVANYFSLMRQIAPEVEALTGNHLEMPKREDIDRCARDYDELLRLLELGYSPMTYLRHHGFPSPLLDWSASPYVAAYFAFATAIEAKSVAIYVYVERPKSIKVTGSDAPQITALGPIVRAHARHFRQQSRYTVCTKYDQRDGWVFATHQSVFQAQGAEQDFLWKLNIPASERKKVLSSLNRYNLNAFSLFGSEESLMETLAIRLLD
jgi:hypothetical protein